MTTHSTWKQRLYDSYVSSGQAGDSAERADDAPAGRIPQFIARHLPGDRNARLVDLGCGRGDLLRSLRHIGYKNISGIDASAQQVAIARRRGLQDVELGQINNFLLRTGDSTVDVIFLIDVLEHFSREELFATMDEVMRVLRPEGKCIAHVPNAEGLHGMRIRYGDLTHEQAFTSSSATQLLSVIGFRTVVCAEERPVVHGSKSLARRILWELGTLPHRLLLTAETGIVRNLILTQNMYICAVK